MNDTYFPVIDAILDSLRGNGATDKLNGQYLHLTEVQRAENTLHALSKKLNLDFEEIPGLTDVIFLMIPNDDRVRAARIHQRFSRCVAYAPGVFGRCAD